MTHSYILSTANPEKLFIYKEDGVVHFIVQGHEIGEVAAEAFEEVLSKWFSDDKPGWKNKIGVSVEGIIVNAVILDDIGARIVFNCQGFSLIMYPVTWNCVVNSYNLSVLFPDRPRRPWDN